MKKSILAALFCIVTLASMYAGGTQEKAAASDLNLMKAGALTIGVEIGYPPFEDFANDGVTPVGYVITSYSIHYTKLYERKTRKATIRI